MHEVPHNRRFTDEVKADALRRVAAGESIRSVARLAGCHYTVLHSWLKKAGMTRPQPGPRSCPRCADLIAACKLVLASADSSPEMRASVNRIVADAIAKASTPPASAPNLTDEQYAARYGEQALAVRIAGRGASAPEGRMP